MEEFHLGGQWSCARTFICGKYKEAARCLPEKPLAGNRTKSRGELRQVQRDFVAVEVEFHAAVLNRDHASAFDLVTFMNRLVVDHRITAILRIGDSLQYELRQIGGRG